MTIVLCREMKGISHMQELRSKKTLIRLPADRTEVYGRVGREMTLRLWICRGAVKPAEWYGRRRTS